MAGGFAYLITGISKYRKATLEALLAQANNAKTQFDDEKLWCKKDASDSTPGLPTSLLHLLFGYDYIRKDVSAKDRDKLDKWFLGAAEWMNAAAQRGPNKRFPNRLKDDYTPSFDPYKDKPCDWGDCKTHAPITHYGGWTHYGFTEV